MKELRNKQKNKEEIDLIFEFEQEYGDESNWSDEEEAEFNKRWDDIQMKYAY